MTFCQIVLLQSIIDEIPKDCRWKDKVEKYQKEHPEDPIPIPMKDPQPEVKYCNWLLVNKTQNILLYIHGCVEANSYSL